MLPPRGDSGSAPEEFSVEAHKGANEQSSSGPRADETSAIQLESTDSPKESSEEPEEDAAPRKTKPLPKVNAVAREVRIKVTGARAGGASEERDLFAESTTTVLVFEKGGVIRLAAAVTPGQLLFLTNEESQREVVTQVMRKRTYRPTECYVELEFTEPAPGFWGMEFSAATALLPKDQKLIAAAEMIASAETTEDELNEAAPPPSAQDVEALKREVEALRSQLQQLQTPPDQEQPRIVAVSKAPAAFPEAPAKPAAPDTTYQYAPAADLTVQAVPVEAQHEPLCPTSTKHIETQPEPSGVPSAGQRQVPKPALVFRKSMSPPKRSFRARGEFTPGFRAGMLRMAMLSTILAALIGTAWYKGWIPGIHQPKKTPVSSWAGGVTTRVSTVPLSPETSTSKSNPGIDASTGSKATKSAAGLSSQPALEAATGKDTGTGSLPSVTVTERPVAKEKKTPPALMTKSLPVRSLPAIPVSVPVSVPSAGFVPPKLLKAERAIATLDDLHDFETGSVVVDAIIDPAGNVSDARVLSGPPSLRWPALRALKNYKYEPARQNGNPVPAHITVQIKFHFASE